MNKLEGVHPVLVGKAQQILAALLALGHPAMVTDGLRTVARQQQLYAQGRTAPGKIVTNADGVKKRSNHQAHADGYGHAVDIAFLVDGKPSWEETHPWALLGAITRALGLKWGGDFSSFQDKPHVELP